MQKNKLTKGVFSALLLASTVAGADQKYPAADFQPTIVYQDSSVAQGNTSKAPAAVKQVAPAASSEVDSKYPAANFQPKVVYSEPQAQHASASTAAPAAHPTSASSVASPEVDSKYPAANFQPKVVYSDANYKPSSSPAIANSTASNDVVEVANTTATSKAKESDSSYLIALIGLVAAGFFFFRGQGGSNVKAESISTAPVRSPSGVTGVARYLNRVSGTGVSRYLDKQAKIAKAPATGVAKYVARQTVSAKTAQAEAATGVEKYLRDRG